MNTRLTIQTSAESQGAARKSARIKGNTLVALNFRVPFEFRQRIKLSATVRGITMTEFLTAALAHYLGDGGA